MNHIVLGLGFGDEGKGQTVSDLIEKYPKTKMVVRFNGGHQAGHTVILNGTRHIFSSFGAGTLQLVPTYWSHQCTIFPRAMLNERDILVEHGATPMLYIDPMCPVVTPFDILKNYEDENINNHGSVGVGFGATVGRQESFYKLFAQDLIYPIVLKIKLEHIANYYGHDSKSSKIQDMIKIFMQETEELINSEGITIMKMNFENEDNIIFEGAQGILLDMDFGFFPHVTRSNTTSKNALELLKTNNATIIYTSRTYLTRHGNGPLPFEEFDISYIKKNPNETNVSHRWQGEFRYAPLNLDLIDYAISCDKNFSYDCKHDFSLTCKDQVDDVIPVIVDNKIKEYKLIDIVRRVR